MIMNMEIKTSEVSSSASQTDSEKVSKQKGLIKIFAVGLLLGAGAMATFAYYRNPQIFSMRTPEEQANQATDALVKEVGKLMILPTNEDPTVLNITDPQRIISQQPFFTGAVTGDKLLVYKAASRAIVYSPSRHLIVNVGPVTNDQPIVTQPATSTITTNKK